MDDVALDWLDTGPRNARTGDVYFSPRNGLDETRHTFIGGCNLPDQWTGRRVCTIGEIGFGTGLNFLGASAAFLEHATPDQHLYYIAFEKYPLTAEQAAQAWARWRGELPLADALIEQWPLRIPGFQYLPLHKRVTLLIIHGDAAEALPQLVAPNGIDSWFLDGFAPAKDPSAWADDLYKEMAAHSHNETRLASFTAVSTVRKGLAAAGFTVKRTKGYGYKWHMTVAGFQGRPRPDEIVRPKDVRILGGGLAGSTCANELPRFGVACFIEDNDFDKAASGNIWGAAKPRLTAKPSVRSDWYAAGYSLIRRLVPDDLRRDFPAVQLNSEADLDAYGWHRDHVYKSEDASDIAGIKLDAPALVFPDAMLVKTKDLCARWHGESGLRRNDKEAEITIIATGAATPGLRPVRGQLTYIQATEESKSLRAMLFYGGYIAPAIDGVHVLGATFGRGDTGLESREEDDAHNIAQLTHNAPQMTQEWRITTQRASIRANTPDRLPLVGRIAENTYISTGHGSHGLVSAPLAAAIITAQMLGLPAPVPKAVLKAVAGDRFPAILDAIQAGA